MGSCRFAALIALLLASALLPDPASARVLQGGEKPVSSEGAPAPSAATGGSEKSASSKGSAQSSTAVQNREANKQRQETPPPETTPKGSPPPPWTSVQKDSPPPGGPEPTGGTERKGGGSSGKKKKSTDEIKEVVEKCEDPVDTCLIDGKLSACLQISQTASIGPFVIVQNTGENTITVNVKETSDISTGHLPPFSLTKGVSKKVNISYSNPAVGEIKLYVGSEHCVLRITQPVSDWQQQFQQLAAYATSLNPIYGVYFSVFTVVLVGVVCACCKFARRRRDSGIPYQQLEMGPQAPNSSGANNTTSTVDGWEDGWDDDWDDEEAPAKPSEKNPVGSISANGLSLRSQTNSKDGWDVDWDD